MPWAAVFRRQLWLRWLGGARLFSALLSVGVSCLMFAVILSRRMRQLICARRGKFLFLPITCFSKLLGFSETDEVKYYSNLWLLVGSSKKYLYLKGIKCLKKN